MPGMDRLGHTHGYRPARIPGWARLDPEEDMETGEDDEEYDDEDDDHEHCWPDDAYHGEMFFGYAYDAGDHRLRE